VMEPTTTSLAREKSVCHINAKWPMAACIEEQQCNVFILSSGRLGESGGKDGLGNGVRFIFHRLYSAAT
jgi:hypothetical protein